MNMRKPFVLIIFFLILLKFSTFCQAGFDLYPRELIIKMDDEFIQGNTSRNITFINVDGNSINITWYLDHPDPISWIRPNRSLIPNLIWIDIKPKYQIIPSKGNAKFDIYLNIPTKAENLKKQWETWIVFKEEENKFINFESTVRLLIDTPLEIKNNNQDQDFLSINIGDKIKIPITDLFLIILVITLILIGLFVIKKWRSK